MVYLDGDNNLESYAIDDFLEMSSVGSTSQMNIVVQFDRSPLTAWSGGSSDYGDWTTTKRFFVERGDLPTASYQVSDLGEANMGSAGTLQSFLEWGMTSYPAANYALVLWDHGGGWVYGVCSDDTSDGDSLLLPEIAQAVTSAESDTGKHIGLMGFDACLMGMTEVAYELRDLTDVVVYSEETEPGQGWAYDKVLGALAADPSMSARQIGAMAVQEYSNFYGSSGKETLSSVATTDMASLSTALDAFADRLIQIYPTMSSQVRQARSGTEHFEYEMFVDLFDFVSRSRQVGDAELSTAAYQLMGAIDSAVLAETSGDQHPGAHGMAIYFPDVVSDLNLVGYRSDASITQNTTWDEFLNIYFGGGSSGGSDSYEDDDTYLLAKELVLGQPQYHSISDGGADVDWAYFTLPSDSDIVIETSGVSGDTELSLYNESGVPGSPMAYDDDSGIEHFSRIVTHIEAGKYYVRVNEYGGDNPIDSYELSATVPLAADAYEPDGDSSSASLLVVGVPQQHSIGDGGADIDWARFTLNSTSNIVVQTSGPSGDTRMWLYVSSGGNLNELDYDDDTGTGLFSLITRNDLPAGDYYVKVDEYGNDKEIPSYQLLLESFQSDDAYEPDGEYSSATALVPGQEQWHSIGQDGNDVDWFSFDLAAPSDVTLETYGTEGDTQLLLYNDAGVPSDPLASDDDSGTGYFSKLTLDSLPAGQYYAKVQAYRAFLFGPEPIPRYGIRLTTGPSAPLDLTVQLQGSQATLNWSEPSNDGGSPVAGYELLRSSVSGQETFYRAVAGLSFVDANLSAGVDYYYQVRAVSSFGEGAPSYEVHVKASGQMMVPGTVTSITIVEHKDHIEISWQAPEANGAPITAYHVLCGQEADGSDRMEIGSVSATSFVDDGVVEGRTYYYWIVAENSYGQGGASATMRATAQDPAMGTGTILLLVLGAVGGLAVLLVVVLLVSRGKRRGGQPGRAPPTQRCPWCGADTTGFQYCGSCGKKLR